MNNITQLTSLNLSGFSRLKKEPYLIPTKTEHYNTYIQDTSRFIAHAGGAVDKQTYTNSLEALNLNYNKGFRLFELDIRKTNDNKFVAVHYWEEWAEKTGFKGSLPPSHQEFLENRLQNFILWNPFLLTRGHVAYFSCLSLSLSHRAFAMFIL